MEPLIFLKKNINVSLNPTKTHNPQTNNIFANIKKALSKNIKIPNPYNGADIPIIIVPNSIFNHI